MRYRGVQTVAKCNMVVTLQPFVTERGDTLAHAYNAYTHIGVHLLSLRALRLVQYGIYFT